MQPPHLRQFHNLTRAAKKIVVVDLGFLGDTVHLIPALCEIKDHYPAAQLHVLTTPVGCEVLQLAPCVDRVWAFPLGPPSPPWWKHWGILRRLRRERFDAAFNFMGTDRSVFVTKLIGARHELIYEGARKHFWQPWLVRHWMPRAALPSPVYVGRRQMLEWCGFELKPTRWDLKVPEADRQWARENIPGGSVHLSLSASYAMKEWPLANNIKLARLLLNSDFDRRLVLTTAPNSREQTRLEQFRREINDPRLLPISEKLPIARVAAILERCILHIGPDSGVLHLAVALNLSTIAIFRRYHDMIDWLPQGPKHVHFDAACSCLQSANPPCAMAGESACLATISPESVARQVRQSLLLADSRPPKPQARAGV